MRAPLAALLLAPLAAELARNPGAYLNADGSVNKNAMQGLVGQHFLDAGALSLTSVAGIDVSYPNFGAAGNGDIEALAAMVMMEAAKSARDDLKAIMEATKALNDKKTVQRDAMRASNQALQDAKDAVRYDNDKVQANRDALQDDKDTLSDMGEQDQLRLQMAMDRHSKLMITLSNMILKQSDTSSAILGNMK